jgi:hypothetical protein
MSKKPTKALEKALELVRAAGYGIVPPPCPSCQGKGYVMSGGQTATGGYLSQEDCPRGCPRPQIRYDLPDSSLRHSQIWHYHQVAPVGNPGLSINGIPMCRCGMQIGHAGTSVCPGSGPVCSS